MLDWMSKADVFPRKHENKICEQTLGSIIGGGIALLLDFKVTIMSLFYGSILTKS